jgi:hypothetical protein
MLMFYYEHCRGSHDVHPTHFAKESVCVGLHFDEVYSLAV